MARHSKRRRKPRLMRVKISRLPIKTRRLRNSQRLVALGAIFIFGLIMLITIWLIRSFFAIRIDIKDVEAFKIPANEITYIYAICAEQQKDPEAALTTYLIHNRFFVEKQSAKTKEQLMMDFFPKMEALRKRIPKRQYEKYYALIETLATDLKCFPLPYESGSQYIYGDTWSTKREMCATSRHTGCDIFDRENIPGRLLVVSMTTGIIETKGKNGRGGMYVGVRTEKGSYYLYDNLDRVFESLEQGSSVAAGTPLGYMGNGGKSDTNNVKGYFPTNVHIGFKIKTSLGKSEIWLNPYPYLRYLEDKMYAENEI